MDDSSNTPDLLSLTYDAATDYRKWPYVLASLIRTVGVESAALYFIDSRSHDISFMTTAGIAKETVEGFKQHYKYSRQFETLVTKTPVGDIVAANKLTTNKTMASDPITQNVLIPSGIHNYMASTIVRDEAFTAVVTLHTNAETGPFRRNQVNTFNKYAPHLARAINIQRKFNTLEGQRQGMSDLLQRVPLGVMLLSKDGLVMEMNKRAEKIVENGEGLAVDRAGHLRTENSKDNKIFSRLITQSISADHYITGTASDAMTIESPASGKKLGILATPLRRHQTVTAGNFPAAAIFIGDPGGDTGSSVATLRKLYGLTRSEARLAEALSTGKNLKQISEEFGVSISTLRSQLHSSFGKTNSSNQGDLIRLVLTGPAAYGKQSTAKK